MTVGIDQQVILRSAAFEVSKIHLPRTVDVRDARQEAAKGFLSAMVRYDPSRKTKPATFGSRRARGAVLDYLRTLDPCGRTERRRIKAEGGQESVIVLSLTERDCQEFPSPDGCPAPELVRRHEIDRIVAEAMRTLPERERYILRMLFWAEIPATEVANQIGRSVERVYQLRLRALGILRENLKARNMTADKL